MTPSARGRHLAILALLGLTALAREAQANGYQLQGTVYFTNLQSATAAGAIIPYVGFGQSPQIGWTVQTGAIRNLSGLIPVNSNTFIFYGEVAPHPWMPRHPRVHLIETGAGNIFCAWTAVFTLQIISPNGDAIFSGDGNFTVHGGTERYRKATGAFRTLFQSVPIPAGANDASAHVTQRGWLKR
jgi:hypothetical protein